MLFSHDVAHMLLALLCVLLCGIFALSGSQFAVYKIISIMVGYADCNASKKAKHLFYFIQ